MKTMLKYYFGEKRIWLYLSLTIALGIYLISQGILAAHAWVMLLVIPIAPFYEWFTHKFVLHMNVGHITEIEVAQPEQYEMRSYVELQAEKQIIKGEITAIGAHSVTVSQGLAKRLPWLYYFMEDLHYGHHKEPDFIPLIFAPTLSVILFLGRRSKAAELAIAILFSVFFAKRWVPPRVVFVALLVAATIGTILAPAYRTISQYGLDIQQLQEIDAPGIISDVFSGDQYCEFDMIVYGCAAVNRSLRLNYGMGFYNSTIGALVPRQLVGASDLFCGQ